jgi:hypothetical protein
MARTKDFSGYLVGGAIAAGLAYLYAKREGKGPKVAGMFRVGDLVSDVIDSGAEALDDLTASVRRGASGPVRRSVDRAPRREVSRYEAPRREAPRYEPPRREAPRYEASRRQTFFPSRPRVVAQRPTRPHGYAPTVPYGMPQFGAPQFEYGGPQYGGPQYGSPQYGSPQYGIPQYGSPQYDDSQYGGSQYSAPPVTYRPYPMPQKPVDKPVRHVVLPEQTFVTPAEKATPIAKAGKLVSKMMGGTPSTPKGGPDLGLKEVQIILNKKRSANLVEDGIMGPHTSDAIKAFQGDNGLDVTGTLDKKTHDAILALWGEAESWTPAWMSAPLLADKQKMSQEGFDALNAMSPGSQQSLAWQSFTTGKTMEELMKG